MNCNRITTWLRSFGGRQLGGCTGLLRYSLSLDNKGSLKYNVHAWYEHNVNVSKLLMGNAKEQLYWLVSATSSQTQREHFPLKVRTKPLNR